MAIFSIEIDLEKLDKALGGKGLVADFNDPKKKVVLPAEGSDVTDEQITQMALSQEAVVIAERAQAEAKINSKEADKAALLKKLGITADEAALLLQ